MEQEKKTLFEKFKECSKKAKGVILGIFAVVIIAIVCIFVFAPSGETTFSVKTSLKEVLESTEMSTAEYTYNSIVQVPIDNEKPLEEDNIKYQIAYKGKVKSGFDFSKINMVEKNGSIIIIIPKIEVKSVDINEDLEYIFTKDKYNDENGYAEAYNACIKDLEKKAKENKTLHNTAIESATDIITAITKPFEKQLEDGKTIQVVYIDDYSQGVK